MTLKWLHMPGAPWTYAACTYTVQGAPRTYTADRRAAVRPKTPKEKREFIFTDPFLFTRFIYRSALYFI